MKFFALITVSLLAVSAQANSIISCPKGTEKVTLCQSTPMDHDSEEVAAMFDYITVCRGGGSKGGLIVTKGNASDVKAAKVEARVGATNFIVQMDGAQMNFSTLPSGRFGTLTMTLPQGIAFSSTYSCGK
jgi:hypothetical protein